MMARRMVFVIAVLLAGSAVADDLKSGPQVGCDNDRRGFRPEFVTGPSAGKSLCPV